MKKKSKIYKNYMNRKIIQIYTVETLQLFTLCLWTMLQHVKVGHIALSQMVIFIFGLKTPHLIYLGPTGVRTTHMYVHSLTYTCQVPPPAPMWYVVHSVCVC